MKYALIKVKPCSNYYCYRLIPVGSAVPYNAEKFYEDVNIAFKAAEHYNGNNSCECQVEVREVE